MKDKIEVIEKYLEYFPKDFNAKNNLLLCKYADELGIELTDYYPRIEYGFFVINRQIKVGKGCVLTNSTTKYEQNGKDSLVIWSESTGRFAFVSGGYYDDIIDEWEEFMDVLKSYNPLDYDELNNKYIYDIENGKKLINDYKDIVNDLEKKINKKIKMVQLEKKKKELERLQAELEASK